MELSYLLKSLLRRKWIIIGATLLATLLTALFVLFKNKEYKSTAQYATGFTTPQVSLVNEEFNLYEADIKFNNVLETFNSPKVIGMVSYNLLLHDLQNPQNPYRKPDLTAFQSQPGGGISPAKAIEILNQKIGSIELLSTTNANEKKVLELLDWYGYDFKSLKKYILIQRVGRTDYLSVEYKSENPELSATIVNKIGSEFLRFFTSINATSTTESVEKISGIVDEKKRQVDSITENLRKLKVEQGSLDPTDISKNALQTVSQLNSRLADERTKYNKDFHQLQSVNNQLKTLNSTSAENSNANNNQEIVAIKSRLRELALSKNDPKVNEEIKRLQEDLKKHEAIYNSPTDPGNSEIQKSTLQSQKSDLEESLKATDQTIAYLLAEISKYSGSNSAGAGSDVRVSSLKNEVDIATREYSDLKSKYLRAQAFEQSPGINFRQTLMGQPAIYPEPSYFPLYVGIAAVSVFSFCSLVIILLQFLDSSVKSPSRFKNEAGLKLLSPLSKLPSRRKQLPDIAELVSANVQKTHEQELFLNCLRKLRFDIENSGKSILLVTSTKKGEGKTIFIEALAYSLSMVNKRVLIIDTNFSNNSLTRNFAVNRFLEEFSHQPIELNRDNLRNFIFPTKIQGVDIIGCKGGDYTPDEVLGNNNVLRNLKDLTGYYDYIILEGAALNIKSDSMELSKYADGVIGIFSADSVIHPADKESITFLAESEHKFLGGVLNKVQEDNLDM
jgi:succinoglycan biosynthesis transport protein ExoP